MAPSAPNRAAGCAEMVRSSNLALDHDWQHGRLSCRSGVGRCVAFPSPDASPEESARREDPGVDPRSRYYKGWQRTRAELTPLFAQQRPFDGVFGFIPGAYFDGSAGEIAFLGWQVKSDAARKGGAKRRRGEGGAGHAGHEGHAQGKRRCSRYPPKTVAIAPAKQPCA